MAKTLLDKLWERHLVKQLPDGQFLLYIDRHLVHEVTSPQAFEGLRLMGRSVHSPQRTLAVLDHNIPTQNRHQVDNPIARRQINELEKNCQDFGIEYYGFDSERQGIVHVIGPELGFTLPGLTIVCGDSHTSTHGAFGALAFGIGTSEVEHVLATQTLIWPAKPKNFLIRFEGTLNDSVTSKDMILALIGQIGTAGGTGAVFEYAGSTVNSLSMEQRMTICNMSIEAGARAGFMAPDQTTFDYFTHTKRPFAPSGHHLTQALEDWKTLYSDPQASFDKTIEINSHKLEPQISWGTNPGMITNITGTVPHPQDYQHGSADSAWRALKYMDLQPGQRLQDTPIDVVFIGSCTNSRIEDLRLAASLLKDKKIAPQVEVLVVPGSQQVRKQAETEGLHTIFKQAGAQWRLAGCSMCLGMNPDQLKPGQRCVSTSNRNFEGRQGQGGRTHLASPLTAAASALTGKITDPRSL